MAEQYYCKKCNRTMNADQFYGSNNLEKYPEGKLDQCKKCISMHVDNFNADTYMWILQECDVPYIPEEWDKLLLKYGKDRAKMTGTTILGRYLSKMKLTQYRDFKWKDTEFLQEKANKRIEETMKRQGYDAQQIAEAIDKATITVPDKELVEPEIPKSTSHLADPNEDYFAEQGAGGSDDFEDTLTDEDRTMLRLKWGKTYRPEEWVKLEQLYEEMMNSYDIQGAGHIDTLKLICKASLKANQLIDIGDIEGFQKISKVYDSLMKSGRFTAAQNKAETGEFVDSISELVEICEKEGFIPRFYMDGPNDKVDETLLDLKHYTNTLVTDEMNLGNLIENAVKEMTKEEAKEEDEDVEDSETMSYDDIERELEDNDFIEHKSFIESEANLDRALLKSLEGN